ncbi:DUF159 family protein [Alteromonas aestuariivivens]|uniref:Abasic site processing protein n=1 Tax=Alteromonas aestuariivivens TaxID=1938339 RepID=A0A3D8M8D9_9ALTE|nr:SOS response-associated peptidase family protein [Alteromonas aestuariivivens]RDV25992.1 DUF159 family protein [Alteromonas aestuariivivens]
MCGRLNITDSLGVRALCEQLEIDLWPATNMRFGRFIRATDTVSIVFEHGGKRLMQEATWWLLLDAQRQNGTTVFKPSRYTSFNTRYDKLDRPGSAGYASFRQQRCVIPITGFGETVHRDGKNFYYDISAQDGMALGGLYRIWRSVSPDGTVTEQFSCSVVTLPPHPKMATLHPKSCPLMLSVQDGSVSQWLSCHATHTGQLKPLLQPAIRQRLCAQQIDKPSTYQPVGDFFWLDAD